MTNRPWGAVVRHIYKIARKADTSNLTDRQLLERFASQRDEAAFAALVSRHGGLVLRVCWRVLHHAQDTEDVFQATFLVLARKAASVRWQQSVGHWLHEVAYRLAVKAKISSARRLALERQAVDVPKPILSEAARRELCLVLDEELLRLPEKYRKPLVLCHLEGESQDQAAQRLGWSVRTLQRRLAQGRKLLRSRLTRRGMTLSAALLAMRLGEVPAPAVVPTLLLKSTVKAGSVFAGSAAAGAGISGTVAALANGMLKSMAVAKLKLVTVLALVAAFAAAGAGILAHQGPGSSPKGKTASPAVDKESVHPEPQGESQTRTDQYGDPLPSGAIARMGTTRLRHGEPINLVAFLADSRALISADSYRLHFWETATGKELHPWPVPAQPLRLAAIGPDGKTLAVADNEGQVQVLDAATGQQRTAFHADRFPRLVFSRDGRLLASTGGDTKPPVIRLWDPLTGQELRRFKGHEDTIHSVAFSPDGQTLASGADDKTVRFWDVPSGREIRQIKGLPNEVGTVAFSPDGRVLATIGLHTFRSPNSTVSTAENKVRLWDAATTKELRQLVAPDVVGQFQGNPYGFMSLAFAPDGKTLVTGGVDGLIRFWDPATGKQSRKLPVTNSTSSLAFSPDGRTLASGGGDKTVHLWDVATGRERLTFGGHGDSVYAVVIPAGGKNLVTAGWDGTIRLWGATTGRETGQLGGHNNGVMDLVLSPDGRTLLSASDDQAARLWDLSTGRELHRVSGLSAGLGCLAVSPDGKLLAALSAQKSVLLLDWATGQEIRRLTAAPATVAFTPDSRKLLTWSNDKTVRLWDVATGKELRSFLGGRFPTDFHDRVYCVAFSPDGKLVAFGGQVPTIILHDVETGKEVRKIEGLPGAVSSLAFSPDSRTLASGGWSDSVVRFWEVATGKPRAQFPGHQGRVFVITFSPDGKLMASGDEDTTAILWDVTGRAGLGRKPPVKPSAEELAARWAELAGADAAQAYRAVWAMAASPEATIPFLAQRLKPVTPVEAGRLTRLIRDLDSNDYAVREKATQELQALGSLAESALRTTLSGRPSLEVHRRTEQLLGRLQANRRDPSGPGLRILRAVELLEQIGMPEARPLLEGLARGAPEAQLTEEAKASLDRLAKQPRASP